MAEDLPAAVEEGVAVAAGKVDNFDTVLKLWRHFTHTEVQIYGKL